VIRLVVRWRSVQPRLLPAALNKLLLEALTPYLLNLCILLLQDFLLFTLHLLTLVFVLLSFAV
jgi:hypothetical protein